MGTKNNAKKVAIYIRVSTKDQNADMQLHDLKDYVTQRGFKLFKVYSDESSGTSNQRKKYLKLLDDAHKRLFDIVLVWRFDRFSRSTKDLVTTLETFQNLNIDFISYKENIDTTSSMGKAVFTIISAIAEFERAIIVDRVKSGLTKAKKKGKQLGRPRKSLYKQYEIIELRKKGLTLTDITEKTQLSLGSVHTILKKNDTQRGTPKKISKIKANLYFERNSKFVRGKKKTYEEVAQSLKWEYKARKLPNDQHQYVFEVAYESFEELDERMWDLLGEMNSTADYRHCYSESSLECEELDKWWN